MSKNRRSLRARPTRAAPDGASHAASNRLRPYALLLVLVTALAYAPAIRNDFVNWDDPPYVCQNPKLRLWSWQALASHFIARDPAHGWTLPKVMANYHPLTMLSLHLDYRLSPSDLTLRPGRETELGAAVFHATSVLLHTANTLLVFLVVLSLLRLVREWPSLPRNHTRDAETRSASPDATSEQAVDAPRVAFLTALLFGIATLHVESVAWISERKDVLYAFFFFLSLLAWLEHLRTGARRWALAALAAFLLSLLSKGQAVTLALTLPALDLLLGRRLRGQVLLEKVPFVALALVFGLVAVQAQAAAILVPDAVQPWPLRPLFAAYGLVHYLLRLLLPIGLHTHYSYAHAIAQPVLLYAVCPILVAALAVALARIRRRHLLLSSGVLFFVLNVAPVVQLLPVGTAVMADRYTYVPSAGVFLAAALVLDRALFLRPRWRRWLLGGFAVYCLAIGAATLARISVWRNSETLWTEELRADPQSTRAHNNLGLVLRARASHQEAQRHFRTAVEIDPRNYEAWNNLGTSLSTLGRQRDAVTAFQRALSGDSAFVVARTNLGDTLLGLGDLDAAVEQYRQVLRVQPRYHVARGGLMEALRRLGRGAEAEAECRAGLALEPGSLRYSVELGKLLADRGAYAESIALLERVHADDPAWTEATSALGSAHLARGGPGDAEQAAGYLQAAASQHPESSSGWNDLALAERRLGRDGLAEEHLRRALEIDPANAVAHANLGALLGGRGREEEAAAHLREAVRLRPDEADHARALAWLLATAQDPRVRSPKEALPAAARAVALTRGEDALALYALGLAEAAEGDDRKAAATLGRALAVATAAGDTGLMEPLRRQLRAWGR